MKKTVIITGGGVGKRMGADMPKQFLKLGGKPIIIRTVERFLAYDPDIEVVVVLPSHQLEFWGELHKKYPIEGKVKVTSGGKERFQSVVNGLKMASGDLIAVHDAVRPLVSIEVIKNCFNAAHQKGAAIPVMPLVESLRQVTGENTSRAVSRSDYKTVQTPQCFKVAILKKAYDVAYQDLFTDDASVVEHAGYAISLVNGNEENIKITTPHDLKWAEILVKNE